MLPRRTPAAGWVSRRQERTKGGKRREELWPSLFSATLNEYSLCAAPPRSVCPLPFLNHPSSAPFWTFTPQFRGDMIGVRARSAEHASSLGPDQTEVGRHRTRPLKYSLCRKNAPWERTFPKRRPRVYLERRSRGRAREACFDR